MNRSSSYLAAGVITTVVLLFLVAYSSLFTGVSLRNNTTYDTQGNSQPVVVVLGSAHVDVVPDVAVVILSVEQEGSTPSEALSKTATVSSGVVSTIKELGIPEEDIKTSGFSVRPKYRYYNDGRPPTVVGYIATHSIQIRTKQTEKVGIIIERAVEAGANRVDALFYELSKELQSKVEKQLLTSAVENAKDKAEAMLTAVNLQIKGVKSLEVIEQAQPVYYPRAVPEMKADAQGIPAMPGTLTVSTSVRVVFIIG